MERQRCDDCKEIPLVKIHNPQEYMLCMDSFMRMVNHNKVEIVYQTCPLDQVIKDGKFYTRKIFHQFRCNTCGCIYGMYVDATQGGEIKLNDKVFNPSEYDSPKK
ncbi:MAG: hypothetical protein LUI06_08315 [Ruminococcus sp.]|nr:hypothetical protein [Ruminococcus sp.]